jgi:hypothetical protein
MVTQVSGCRLLLPPWRRSKAPRPQAMNQRSLAPNSERWISGNRPHHREDRNSAAASCHRHVRNRSSADPKLVAEVRFVEWTRDHHVRHPSFLGLGEDKKARDVVIDPRAGTALPVSSSDPSQDDGVYGALSHSSTPSTSTVILLRDNGNAVTGRPVDAGPGRR